MTRDINWVKALDSTFIECRSLRHAWKLHKFEIVPKDEVEIYARVESNAQVIQRRVGCLRCGCLRIDLYVRNNKKKLNGFERHSSRYIYPKGYTFKGSEHKLNTPRFNDYVVESFRRETV